MRIEALGENSATTVGLRVSSGAKHVSSEIPDEVFMEHLGRLVSNGS